MKKNVRLEAAAVLLLLFVGCAAAIGFAIWPQATGENRKSSHSLVVDMSNAADGYVMAKASQSNKKLKLRVVKDSTTLTYDLNNSGEYEVFPLQLGSGTYQFALFKNASGQRYSQDGKLNVKVTLNDENAPFLCPNQYVNYTHLLRHANLTNRMTAERKGY